MGQLAFYSVGGKVRNISKDISIVATMIITLHISNKLNVILYHVVFSGEAELDGKIYLKSSIFGLSNPELNHGYKYGYKYHKKIKPS